MVMGRPQEYNRIEVGKNFLQWAKDHPDCLTVPHFTTANGLNTTRLLEWCKTDLDFREYYTQAKEQIGINRLNATMNIDPDRRTLDKTIYLRHVGNFDPDKRAFDREEKEFESSLKLKEIKAGTEEERRKADEIVKQLDKLQEGLSSSKPNSIDNA